MEEELLNWLFPDSKERQETLSLRQCLFLETESKSEIELDREYVLAI